MDKKFFLDQIDFAKQNINQNFGVIKFCEFVLKEKFKEEKDNGTSK